MSKKTEKYKRKCKEILTLKDKELSEKDKAYVSLKDKLTEANEKMNSLKEQHL